MASNIHSGYADEDDGSMLSDINVTPLVDVTLVLLIVFMITVPAIIGSAPVKVDLPESTAVAATSEQLPLVFSLRRSESGELELYLNERRIDEAGVRKMFHDFGTPNDDQPVSLAADKGIPYGEVIKIVDLLQSMGLQKLSLDTRHVEPR
jgi:biopolymer transport protein ExbD